MFPNVSTVASVCDSCSCAKTMVGYPGSSGSYSRHVTVGSFEVSLNKWNLLATYDSREEGGLNEDDTNISVLQTNTAQRCLQLRGALGLAEILTSSRTLKNGHSLHHKHAEQAKSSFEDAIVSTRFSIVASKHTVPLLRMCLLADSPRHRDWHFQVDWAPGGSLFCSVSRMRCKDSLASLRSATPFSKQGSQSLHTPDSHKFCCTFQCFARARAGRPVVGRHLLPTLGRLLRVCIVYHLQLAVSLGCTSSSGRSP